MQSFHSQIMTFLVCSFGLASFNATLIRSVTDILAPTNHAIAAILTLQSFISGFNFMSCLFLTLLTKYLSIYNGPFIASLNEDQVLPIVKSILIVSPMLMALLEYFYLNSIETDSTYQQLRYGITHIYVCI